MGDVRDFQTGAPLSPPLGPHNTHSGAPPPQGPHESQTGAPPPPELGPHHVFVRVYGSVFRREGTAPSLALAGLVVLQRIQSATRPSPMGDIRVVNVELSAPLFGSEGLAVKLIDLPDDIPGSVHPYTALTAWTDHQRATAVRDPAAQDNRKRHTKPGDKRIIFTPEQVARMRQLLDAGHSPMAIWQSEYPNGERSYSAVYRAIKGKSYPDGHRD